MFAGALRKWVTGPGAVGNAMFFGQLLMYFLFAFLLSRSHLTSRFKAPIIYFLFVAYLIAAAINPKNHTLYHGIFGLMIHLGFWVAMVGYFYYRDEFELEKLIGLFLIVLIFEVGLGAIQYALPPDHILNIKSDGFAIDATVGNAVRVSGTFSYIGGYQVMITLYGFIIWFFLILDFPFIFSAIVLALSVYASMINGSRGSLLLLLFVVLFAIVHTGFLYKRSINIILTIGLLSFLIVLFGEKIIDSFENSYSNFSERVEWGLETGETEGRFLEPLKNVTEPKTDYYVYGIGLGSTYQGANILYGESFYSKQTGGYEGELGRIVIEGGYILFFFRIILLIVLLRYSYFPFLGKVVIVIFFLAAVVVFNNYQGVFFLFGFMIVDRAYYLKARGINFNYLIKHNFNSKN